MRRGKVFPDPQRSEGEDSRKLKRGDRIGTLSRNLPESTGLCGALRDSAGLRGTPRDSAGFAGLFRTLRNSAGFLKESLGIYIFHEGMDCNLTILFR